MMEGHASDTRTACMMQQASGIKGSFVGEVIEPPKPLKVQLTDNELIIDWDENPAHRSFFLVPWLMSHAYDGNQETQPISENILWDKAWQDANSDDRQTWTN